MTTARTVERVAADRHACRTVRKEGGDGAEYPREQLGRLVNNFDARRIPLSSREREKRRGPYPYYGATGVMDYIDDYLFEGLHLLIAEDGSVETDSGKPFLQLVDGRFWVNNHAHVLTGASDDETRFLYYALSTVAIRPYMTGSVQAKLSQANLNRIAVPYPPDPDVRRAIAAVLGALDDKIELNRRMCRTLEGIARAIFQAWFVDFLPVRAKAAGAKSFRGMPQAVFDSLPTRLVDSPLGPIPAGWRVVPFDQTVEVLGGGTPNTAVPEYWGGAIPWFSVVDSPAEGAVWVVDTEKHITQIGLDNSSTRILPVGTTILTARGTVGKIALVGTPMAMNQSCYGLRGWSAPHGFFTYFMTKRIVNVLRQWSHGCVFDTLLDPVDSRIEMLARETETLADLRDTLLPRLISGALRVKDAERFLKERGL